MEFQELISQLKQDSKKYQFCEEGVDGINKSSSALQCCAFLRENIVYCFDSKYHDAIAENIEEWYKQWKKEFNQCGIWVNECASIEQGLELMTAHRTSEGLSPTEINKRTKLVFGKWRCYVFGKKRMKLVALDHAKVYSKNPNAHICLSDHSHGFIQKSSITLTDFAVCYAEDSRVVLRDQAVAHITQSCKKVLLTSNAKIDSIQHLAFQ